MSKKEFNRVHYNVDKFYNENYRIVLKEQTENNFPKGEHGMKLYQHIDDEGNTIYSNEQGEYVGGLQASVVWSYCVLELLWLSEETRGQGVGSELIEQLVAFAKEKQLTQIRTETLDFQAKPFYEKQGFKVYGEIDDSPKGHKTYFLVKVL